MAWSGLPAELLRCISSHLPVVDYVRLTTVCTSWNSALANKGGRHHVLRTHCRPSPWLLLPSNVEEASHTLAFRDLTIKKCHRRFPSLSSHISGRRCIGSKDGWLVTLGTRDLQPRLFNPLTRSEISLPRLYNILGNHWEDIEGSYAPDGSVEYFIDRHFDDYSTEGKFFLDYYFKKIVLSSNDPSGTAIVIYGAARKLALARPEYQTWVLLPKLPPQHIEWTLGIVDVCYDEDEQRFYAITLLSAVLSFDVNGQNVTLISPPLKSACWYQYIVILSGTLLRIVRNTSTFRQADRHFIKKTDNISVFKLEPLSTAAVAGSSCSSPKWILVRDLGGYSLFVGCNQTFSLHHTEVRGIKRNCVYFSEHVWLSSENAVRDAGRFDLRKRSIKYFLRFDSHPKCSPSIWFTPSLP